jgi:predicted RND superfamily exporter protein
VTPSRDGAARLAGWLVQHKKLVLLVATFLLLVGGYRTVRTYASLRSEIEELLPVNAPSVQALDRARSRLPGLRSLGVVIETGGPHNVAAANRFVDELAARVEKYPKEQVSAVQVDLKHERKFAETYALQLMTPADAKLLREAVEQRRDWEVTRATGSDILDEDEDPPPKVPIEELKQKYERRFGPPRKFVDDRFVSEDGATVVMIIRTGSHATNYSSDASLLARVKAEVKDLGFPEKFASGMNVGYAGDVPTRVEEMEGLATDLGVSGVLVFGLVVFVLLWYFRSWRALPILWFPLAVGTLFAFFVVSLPPFSITSLNSNTAFLGSIVVGNGINSGIMVLARFREERIAGQSLQAAIETAISTTWRPTLAAAGAAAAAYTSLTLTDFRGFAQFGWLGGFGLLLCWAAAILLIPPMCALLGEKMSTTAPRERSFGLRAATFVFGRPRVVIVLGVLVCVLAGLGVYRRGGDWIQYDLSKLRRRDSFTTGERYFGLKMDATMGRFLTPSVVMADDGRQAGIISERIRTLQAEHRAGDLIATVRSSADVLPPDREQSLREARLLAKALTPKLKERLTKEQRTIVERATSPEALELLTPEKVPDSIAAGLRERDGRMDRNVLIFPKPGGGTWDAVKLTAFASDVREAVVVDGKPSIVTGSLLISSDIAAAMTRDGPRATFAAFMSVVIVCILAFRSFSLSLIALASLVAGVVVMLGAMAWSRQYLNFSNFVALPITFGIGADYAVNVLKRYQQEGKLDLRTALSETGGALALCSATTVIGYGSLLVAQNRALFSFGVFAISGELACLVTAIVGLPAALAFLPRK